MTAELAACLSIIERIEQIEAEIGELAEAKREIFLEAKGNGYDVKILREVIRIRKQDPKERDEQESLLDVYWEAIKNTNIGSTLSSAWGNVNTCLSNPAGCTSSS